ncbi:MULTISPECIES: heavy-metal-associated domain-containing protein [unclassified Paenibacillus]|uniref:heavy-metal-associated domain-containing protein n=1 Tax=unclassified Paenibacillus TaxID=185978 RepID=UPI00363DFB30
MKISEEKKLEQATIKVTGMTCFRCANRIQKELYKLAGVSDANVNFLLKQASVTYNPAEVSVLQIEQMIKTLGYNAVRMQGNLQLNGKTPLDHTSGRRNSSVQSVWAKIVSLVRGK